jgi:hypothetical protein
LVRSDGARSAVSVGDPLTLIMLQSFRVQCAVCITWFSVARKV